MNNPDISSKKWRFPVNHPETSGANPNHGSDDQIVLKYYSWGLQQVKY